jgi:ABC-2 type transport system permease protein
MTTLKSIGALYLANAREFVRDRMTFFLVLLLPVALAVFFGLIFGGSDAFTLQIGVVDEGSGAVGEMLVSGLSEQETLGVHQGTREELLEALQEGEVSVILVLPAETTARLAAGEPAAIEVLYDPARPLSGGTGLSFVRTSLAPLPRWGNCAKSRSCAVSN